MPESSATSVNALNILPVWAPPVRHSLTRSAFLSDTFSLYEIILGLLATRRSGVRIAGGTFCCPMVACACIDSGETEKRLQQSKPVSGPGDISLSIQPSKIGGRLKISVVERSAAIDQTIEMLEQEERGEVSENEKCRLFSEF